MPPPGQSVEMFTMSVAISPSSFGVINNLFYVRDVTTNHIFIFDIDGVLLKEITPSNGATPTGVKPLPDGNIMLINYGVKSIDLFSETGQFIKRLYTGLITNPLGFNIAGNTAVTVNSATDNLYVYTLNEEAGTAVLRKTISLGALGTTPRGCDILPDGNILICFDTTEEIMLIDQNGKKLQSIPTPSGASSNPIDVKYDPFTGDVYTTVGSSSKMYKCKFPQ